ncbi:MAG: hypothetical protein COA57_01975 [Flavobacteriales bacterium]|nr:MAG: hypothetical protein COA57_01975 [Flavobacteriales bacterium]
MRSLSKAQLAAITVTILLCVLLYFAPNKPKIEPIEINSLDVKVEQAIALVHEGKEPMKGIMLLREVLKEDSMNVMAHFHLGVFSIQSNQYEKAVGRFKRVLEIDAGNTDAYYYLGHAHAGLGQKERAIENFEKFKSSVSDEKRKADAEKYINELKNI